jgi:hypothetical protein
MPKKENGVVSKHHAVDFNLPAKADAYFWMA